MKITILDGNPEPISQAFETYLAQLTASLETSGSQVTRFQLRDLDIRYCSGCFGCWVKTPGECLSKDDSCLVCQAIINSDFILWAAPLRMGFPSALLKKMMDKMIPLIHPYFTVDHNEAHHRARYAHYPRLGLLVEREATTSEVDMALTADIFSRTALNIKSRLEFCLDTNHPVEDVTGKITTDNPSYVEFAAYPTPTRGVSIPPPQRLTIFNGSPRGQKGNTPIMLAQVANGFTSQPGRSSETFHLHRLHEMDEFARAFASAECVLLGFPLYTDGMPGIVKTFIEALEPFTRQNTNPPFGFLVQSGFPESVHSRHVERYLEALAQRLNAPYLGTIVKGGCEGVRMMPENMNRKLFDGLMAAGKSLAGQGQFDSGVLQSLAKPEHYPRYLVPVFKLLMKLPMLNFYWDNQLKENNTYLKRFARPYQP